MSRFTAFACVMLLTACSRAPEEPSARNPLEALPIDSARLRSLDETLTWQYRQYTDADLNGDGEPERVVLTADVEVDREGRAIWEDGHRWAAYVETTGAQRTLLYAAFVPNGFVELAVLAPDTQRSRRVLVLERTPEQLRAVELQYDARDHARLASAAHYQLEEWVPGFATLP